MDWADEKARTLCPLQPQRHQFVLARCAYCDGIAAALREERARAEKAGAECNDYRSKAIQRQQDFDGAAHACDVLQGKL